MTRETAQLKAVRLAGSGRVSIRRIETDLIVAVVRGDSAREYGVRWAPSGWRCTCPALSRTCSHVRAVMLVVLEPTPAGPRVEIA